MVRIASGQGKVFAMVLFICGVAAVPMIRSHMDPSPTADAYQIKKAKVREERLKNMRSDDMPPR